MLKLCKWKYRQSKYTKR